MIFNIGRPTPRFSGGELVALERQGEYFLIYGRRWVKPIGSQAKQWVYDGMVYGIEGHDLKYKTTMTCALENTLYRIH